MGGLAAESLENYPDDRRGRPEIRSEQTGADFSFSGTSLQELRKVSNQIQLGKENFKCA